MESLSEGKGVEPQELLGRSFRALLPLVRSSPIPVRLRVTRPTGYAYGRGEMRIVSVRTARDALELVLAYEQYGFWPKSAPEERDSKNV